MKCQSLLSVFLVPVLASAFSPAAPVQSHLSSTCLQAGILDSVFGPKKAEASHILLTGNKASQQCEKLKVDIYNTAMKKGAVEGGIRPEALMSAVRSARTMYQWNRFEWIIHLPCVDYHAIHISYSHSPSSFNSQFSQAASRRSTCPSKSDGGSLGTFGRGQMVPEFDAVVFGEDVGVIHGPVDTQFGSHLILVTNRK